MWTGLGGPFVDRMGINVRVLDDIDADALSTTKFDGRKALPGMSPLERNRQAEERTAREQGQVSAGVKMVI